MKTIQQKTDEFRAREVDAARACLQHPERYGPGMIEWAKLVMEKEAASKPVEKRVVAEQKGLFP